MVAAVISCRQQRFIHYGCGKNACRAYSVAGQLVFPNTGNKFKPFVPAVGSLAEKTIIRLSIFLIGAVKIQALRTEIIRNRYGNLCHMHIPLAFPDQQGLSPNSKHMVLSHSKSTPGNSQAVFGNSVTDSALSFFSSETAQIPELFRHATI